MRSVGQVQTRAWHRAHKRHYRRTWVVMVAIVVFVGLLVALGYFGTVSWPALLDALLHTTYRLAVAYFIALVIGGVTALLVGWSPFTDVLFPIFDVLQNIPSFALIPFFIYFFGYTDLMIILFAVTSIIWPILFAVLAAIKSTHADLNDAATIFGARGIKRIPYYLAPLSIPAILTGSLVGIAIGWEAVIGAEIIVNLVGFGSYIKSASATGVDQTAVAGLIAILLLVFVVNRLVWAPLLSESNKRYAE